jgi:hypothetical protein
LPAKSLTAAVRISDANGGETCPDTPCPAAWPESRPGYARAMSAPTSLPTLARSSWSFRSRRIGQPRTLRPLGTARPLTNCRSCASMRGPVSAAWTWRAGGSSRTGPRTSRSASQTSTPKRRGSRTGPPFETLFSGGAVSCRSITFMSGRKPAMGKQRYAIALADRGLMALAGLWENWRSPAGEWVRSFAIVTCPPNELCTELHNRMPVVLGPETWPAWLG